MKLFYILLALITLISCEKEKELTIFHKWLLIDGYVYTENMDTGEKIRYEHFGSDKIISQLTYLNNYDFEFEKIEVNKTTWEFKLNGNVIINDNTDQPLYLEINGDMMSITENPYNEILMLAGSARPFQGFTEDYGKGIIRIHIQESYGSFSRYNTKWYNVLYFKQID